MHKSSTDDRLQVTGGRKSRQEVGFHFFNFHALLLVPFASGHCYYQTVLTPESLPNSPSSQIPHTVTLVSIPGLDDGTNGHKGRGFSVAVDQPTSPADGFGQENGHTLRVSQ